MHVATSLFETQQVQPLGFWQDFDVNSLLPPLGDFAQFDGRLAVDFQRPAFLADDQHRGLLADAVSGRAPLLLGQVHRLPMRHRSQRAGEAQSFALQDG